MDRRLHRDVSDIEVGEALARGTGAQTSEKQRLHPAPIGVSFVPPSRENKATDAIYLEKEYANSK
jgi:hypothetical protein